MPCDIDMTFSSVRREQTECPSNADVVLKRMYIAYSQRFSPSDRTFSHVVEAECKYKLGVKYKL